MTSALFAHYSTMRFMRLSSLCKFLGMLYTESNTQRALPEAETISCYLGGSLIVVPCVDMVRKNGNRKGQRRKKRRLTKTTSKNAVQVRNVG